MLLNLPLFLTNYSSFPTLLAHFPPRGNKPTSFLSQKKATSPIHSTIVPLQSLNSSLKLWRLFITKQLLTFLETSNLLSDHQYGFRKARSTGDLLAYAVHVWSSAPESSGESRVISLDISKAFDRVWHKGLLAKLPMFGLHHTLINWISSFLSDRSIAVRVDGFLSNLHSINAGVPQGSVISPVLFILFINDLLTSTSSIIHSLADDTFLSSSFSFNPNDHASTDIQLHRNTSASLLSNDLTVIEKWGKDNLVSFNQSKTKQAVISRKRNQNFPAVLMNGDKLDTTASFTQLGLSLSSNLTWKNHIHSLAKHASQKLGFLARARGFFSYSHLLSMFKSQICPSLEYCSHVWGGAPKSTLCLLDKVQPKAIRLMNNPNLTKSLQPLSHRRLVGDLSIYYRYFNGHCSQEIRDIIPVPLRRVRTTRSSTHSHSFQVSLPNPRTLISQIILHPKNMQLMERLAFFLLS